MKKNVKVCAAIAALIVVNIINAKYGGGSLAGYKIATLSLLSIFIMLLAANYVIYSENKRYFLEGEKRAALFKQQSASEMSGFPLPNFLILKIFIRLSVYAGMFATIGLCLLIIAVPEYSIYYTVLAVSACLLSEFCILALMVLIIDDTTALRRRLNSM